MRAPRCHPFATCSGSRSFPRRCWLKRGALATAVLAVLVAAVPAQLQFDELRKRGHLPIDSDYTDAVAFADVDLDGDLDLVFGNASGQQNRLYAGSVSDLRAQTNNVLIIVADDVGIDKIGAYGVGIAPPPTPNIDALAANGALFRNAWVSALCTPTRGCLMTGRYPFRTGMGTSVPPNQGGVLRFEETSIPELLDAQGAGYAHAAIGKWHMGDKRNGGLLSPNLAGWSHFAGLISGLGNYYWWPRTVNGVEAFSNVYNTTATVDDALAWIQTAPEPWVCYVAFFAAHTPLNRPPPHLHTYQLPATPTSLDLYRAILEAMDTEIGRLLSGLGAARPRTDVIFIGDNGTPCATLEPPFAPYRGKGTLYQGGILAPLIVSGPSVVAPGREVDALVAGVDVFSTVVELCGATPEVPFVQLDGVSMVPYLTDPAQPPLRTHVFSELFRGESPPAPLPPRSWLAYRDTRYKLIRQRPSTSCPSTRPNPEEDSVTREEFFDLAVDPYETRNLLLGPMTPEQQAAYMALRAGVDQLRSSASRITRYGETSCQGSSGYPSIGWSGPMVMSSSVNVTLTGTAPAQPAILLLGASRDRWRWGSLPFSLAKIGGPPTCGIYAADDFLFPTVSDSSGQATVTLRLPFERTLLQGALYFSWFASDPQAPMNPLGIITSDGLRATLGWPPKV